MTGSGTPNAIVMCKVPISNHDENGIVAHIDIVTGWIAQGDVYYFHVLADDWDDPSTALRVEYEVLSLDPLTVATTIPDGGDDGYAEQVPDPVAEGTAMRLVVCADHWTQQVKAGVVSTGYPQAWADVDPGRGLYIGVGHNNTGHQNHFDNFAFEELRTRTERCADCWCWCLTNVPHRHMTGTITNATGRAACMDGLTWPMDWEYASGTDKWVGEVDIPSAAGSGGGTQTVTWNLKCDANDDDNPDWPGHNWMIYADSMDCQFSTTGGVDSAGTHRASEDSECEPEMRLIFGPFTMSRSELSCYLCYPPDPMTPRTYPDDPESGSFYIEITE